LQSTVTVAVPVLNEETHLGRCLAAIKAQTYAHIIEVLVVDGGSEDQTVAIAQASPKVRVLDNPGRIQAAGLNVALKACAGEVLVRVDGHCVIAPDYVARCVNALEHSGAAIVGGGMTPTAEGLIQEGIAVAMASRLGAGPARFHHSTGAAGWVDTVYLGAYRTELARFVDGYCEDVGVNEDAEFAIRIGRHGGIWFDPTIRSSYVPRGTISSVARQFYRYGRSRAATVRRHPSSLAPRQLMAPMLVVGLASPWRRMVLTSYLCLLTGWVASSHDKAHLVAAAVLPTMHISWGVGFLRGLLIVRQTGQ
jgi:glycosyltransferase involved in cell wall biosynthesis